MQVFRHWRGTVSPAFKSFTRPKIKLLFRLVSSIGYILLCVPDYLKQVQEVESAYVLLPLPMKITGEKMSSNPAQERRTRYNIM